MPEINFKPDTVIGKWRIGSFLGRGGQGAVWVVRPTTTKNSPPRALKASFATDAKDRARFEREATLLQSCASPLVLAMHDLDLSWVSRVNGIPEFAYYVADRCDGSLESMKEQLGDAGVRILLFIEACRSVQYLHALPEPVIHRDIKPANFLVASEPRRVVLADLGIARYEAVSGELTVTEEVVGSRYYRPPEASNGDPGSMRGDVYSLGRVLEWLLTGEVSTNFSTRPIARGGYLSDGLCDALERVITKATQTAPENRFGSVAEMLAQIPDRWVDVRVHVATPDAQQPQDFDGILSTVLDIARRSDTVSMRVLEQEFRRIVPAALHRWRNEWERKPFSDQQTAPLVDALLDEVFGRVVVALGGVLSQHSAFIDQQRLLTDLVSIPDWNRGGRTVLAAAPRGLIYIFHHLHGAFCFDLGRGDLAIKLACTSLPQTNDDNPQPLWQQLDLTGWPKLFADRPDVAWVYLKGMRKRLSVLERFFALPNDFDVGLASYSMLLTLLEFSANAAELATLTAEQFQQRIGFNVPPMFIEMSGETISAAAVRTFGDKAVVDEVLQRTHARREHLILIWPHLKELLRRSRDVQGRPFKRELPLGDVA